MAMPKMVTWCLCMDDLVAKLQTMRMPRGMKRVRTKSRAGSRKG